MMWFRTGEDLFKLGVVMVKGDENPGGFYELIKALRLDKLTWQDGARCRGAGNGPFFLGKGGSPKRAKSICEPCQVKAECAEYGIEYEKFGVWGGMTEEERKEIRIRRREALVVAASAAAGARLT